MISSTVEDTAVLKLPWPQVQAPLFTWAIKLKAQQFRLLVIIKEPNNIRVLRGPI